jgi:hypothetical protein
MKKCSKCLEVKQLSDFSKRSTTKDGLQYNCKACNKLNDKQYKQDNGEAIKQQQKQYHKQYRHENAEKIKQYDKQYQQENAEKISEYRKQWRESLKDGFHRVYILPDHHYAGTTECIQVRMSQHKSDHGRNTENYMIVGVYENREDALAHEKRLHDSGYNGRHSKNRYL